MVVVINYHKVTAPRVGACPALGEPTTPQKRASRVGNSVERKWETLSTTGASLAVRVDVPTLSRSSAPDNAKRMEAVTIYAKLPPPSGKRNP